MLSKTSLISRLTDWPEVSVFRQLMSPSLPGQIRLPPRVNSWFPRASLELSLAFRQGISPSLLKSFYPTLAGSGFLINEAGQKGGFATWKCPAFLARKNRFHNSKAWEDLLFLSNIYFRRKPGRLSTTKKKATA